MKFAKSCRVTFASFLAILLLCATLPTITRADDAPKEIKPTGKCLMWKVTSGKATVYLVGSMHLGKPQMYPLPKEMEEAFAKSDILVVEVNINKIDQQKLGAFVLQKGMYRGGQTLSQSIKKETWEKTRDVWEKQLGQPALALNAMKPWLVGLMIDELAIQKVGLDPKLGIDEHFLDLAEKSAKTIEELETMDFQLNLLAGFDPAMQEKSLVATLEAVKDMKKDLDNMMAALIAGDADALNKQITDKEKAEPDTAEVNQKLIYDRNGGMTKKVEEYLKGDKTVFVIAGAAHMVGDKGVVKLLEQDHFEVDQSAGTREAKAEK